MKGADIAAALERRWFLAVATLGLVALAPRLGVALFVSHEPVWDGQYYHEAARHLAAGDGYGDGATAWSHYPPGYSAFLAIFYAVLGPHPIVGAVAGAIVGALTAVAVAALARPTLGAGRAVLAGGIVALHPGLVLQSGLLMSEGLAALLLVVAGILAARRRSLPALAGAGVVVGLATLVRPASLLVLPAVVALAEPRVIAASRRTAWAVAAPALVGLGVVAGGAAIAIGPWTARNCATLDACALVSTNGGWNAAIGASAHATGRFDELRGSDGCADVAGDVAVDRCWWATARAQIDRDPARFLALLPKKWSYTFDHQAFAIASFAEAEPARWPEGRRRTWMRALAIVEDIVLAFAALGAVTRVFPSGRPRRAAELGVAALGVVAVASGAAWPLALVVAVFGTMSIARGARLTSFVGWAVATVVVVHGAFFGEDRYQVVIEPLLVVLAASSFRRGSGPDPLVASTP